MAKFFIDRPIFAWVIAILTMMIGYISIQGMAIEQYPELAPPTVTVSASYPGADAETLDSTVTQVIERQLTGLDDMLYMSSTSDSTGTVSIEITFANGADVDQAQNQVNNKIQGVLSSLPETVQKYGVVVNKSTGSFLKIIGFYSTDPNRSSTELADIVYNSVQQEISNTEGVGGTQLFGASYAIRVWLDPYKLSYYNLSVGQVISAIQSQNAQVSVGQLGSAPTVKGQALNITVTGQSRLKDADAFAGVLVLTTSDGANIYLRDLGEVELGAESYGFEGRLNNQVSAGLAVMLASGANQIHTSELVDAKMESLSQTLPSDIKYIYPYDTTTFVELSIDSVVHTLIEAIFLVIIVMYVFLQNLRATLIPTLIVPVVLLGTFAVLYGIGFTINTLSMFAMVLAIGLLVDDAIVVVENVERIIHDEGLSPYDATVKSMQQITGALLGIAVVLSAVFAPMAFFGGATGGIFRQFSLTIITAMGLSVLMAIVFAPALCRQILKGKKPENDNSENWASRLSQKIPFKWIKAFFGHFNRFYDFCVKHYINGVKHVIAHPLMSLLGYGLILFALLFGFKNLTSGFLPDEDQGVFMVMFQLPNNSTLEETTEVLQTATKYVLETEKRDVSDMFTVAGFSFMGSGPNQGMAFVKLQPWEARTAGEQKVTKIIGRVQGGLSQNLYGVRVIAVNLPSIPSLGIGNGVDFILQNVGSNSHADFVQTYYGLIQQLAQTKKVYPVPYALADVPEYKVKVDNEAAQTLGVSVSSINSLLSTAFGGAYIDDFSYNNNNRKVYVQGESEYRMSPADFEHWSVPNSQGEMVPFAAFAKVMPSYGSPALNRYNTYPSMKIQGTPLGSVSSGEVMDLFEEYAEKLKEKGYNYQWTGTAYQQKESGGSQELILYGISFIVVFLALAALYESWSIPISVLFVIPLGVLGTIYLTYLARLWIPTLANDIYFKVGLVTTMGLSAKNAILIVEFAKDLIEKEGKPLVEATIEACHLRLRPILMTSFAFIMGVLPLALSSGAGSASQNAVGISVIGGMTSATFLAIFYIPLFFILIYRAAEKIKAIIKELFSGSQSPTA